VAGPILIVIRIVKIAAVFLLALPIAYVITIVTFPIWRWIYLNTSVEAFGHSDQLNGASIWFMAFWSLHFFRFGAFGVMVSPVDS
jgi:hypothetical protein